MSKPTNFLTQSLLNGYAGKTVIAKINRTGFNFLSSHFEKDNSIYHDEWLASSSGGGQELVKVGKEQFTRLYAGGVTDEKTLQKLKITQKDIISFLIKQIQIQKTKTRLFSSCKPKKDGDWQYEYKILQINKKFSLTIAKETISYKDIEVFVHGFLLCPILMSS